MADDPPAPTGPELASGVALADLPDGGKLLGHLGDEQVLLLRRGAEVFAIGASCTHYSGPLAEGLMVGDMIRCPWHHAGFDFRTGEALRAPALSPLPCWSVEQREGKIFVRGKREPQAAKPLGKASGKAPEKIVIIGGGAVGFAAAERLRRVQYQGSIVMLSQDDAAPGRPAQPLQGLSRRQCAGGMGRRCAPTAITPRTASSCGWAPRRPASTSAAARSSSPMAPSSALTGCCWRPAPSRCVSPSRASISPMSMSCARWPTAGRSSKGAKQAKRAVVIGASFIGLEVAAALRHRKIEVHVVAPDKRPMERVLGPQMGDFVRSLHESQGVVFHLEDTVAAIEGKQVKLKSGGTLEADLVVMGVGVRPRIELAEKAGLKIDRGIRVDAFLETSEPGIFAAGDIARWPDPHSGNAIRVEHWVVAERQGQTAALNMLGQREAFTQVPFFWSQHYDIPINYVGHCEGWDELIVEGDIAAKDCLLRFKLKGKVMAVASIFRDLESLQAEAAMEQVTA